MTKIELIRLVSQQTGVSQVVVKEVLNSTRDVLRATVAATGQAVLPGIARFKSVQVKARDGVNPRTREAIAIPAKRVLRAKVEQPKQW